MDIRSLLQSLLEHDVRFLLIGAWALPAYGHVRMTQDVDIFIEPTERNVKRMIAALHDVGYHAVERVSIDTFLKRKVLLRQYALRVDIHPFVRGIRFHEAWKHRHPTEIKRLEVFVPSLRHLIRMKKAAGRLKDKLDLEVLERIQKRAPEES